MEFGTIQREVHVDASPDVVFAVISTPEHMHEWWGTDAVFEPQPGSTGELAWDGEDAPRVHVSRITVVTVEPPRTFAFRWVYDDDAVTAHDNALLVTFDLEPAGDGTMLRLTETGFREKGWEAAVLEAQYREHEEGWSTFLPRIREYVSRLVSTS
jgi:uncharacterized protein YndB with AHSA1/START domain